MSISTINEREGVNFFETEDFCLTVALSTKGYEVVCMHPISNNRSILFYFVAANGIEKAARNYHDGKMQLDPDEYLHEYHDLMACVYGALCHED